MITIWLNTSKVLRYAFIGTLFLTTLINHF